ncbi:MAG: hypothetical protein COB20_01185 [SAR86 cluster bacterium]|uniref:Uncharacterized protein n=1 Tax=SAR86 cluster bacterium TaxID=2030880 RepID=A0A2A4XGX3_9GAMM|nr:MAG: hypothetical protein COB20_01185 [SAR86 cluster bacterium]
MSIVSILNQATKLQSADTALIEKAGWALRRRLRKQMNQLSSSFFDEVDDFVFEAGKKGQFTASSDYLSAMREIRAKQVLFEEIFLDTASNNMKRGNSQFDNSPAASSQNSKSPVIFENMETELAISAMERKANKYYSPYMRQIESLISAIESKNAKHLIRGNTLVSSVLLGFVEAQHAIKINLEIRFVFMKIFEQHFLMELEKLFLDSISILNNIDNKQFVDRLHSSSSSFHMPVASSCTPSEVTDHNSATDSQQLKPDAKAVEPSVSDALRVVQSAADVPNFVQQMAEEHWRMVLLLIGLNKGVSSLEWQEAEHVLQLLVLCSAGQIETNKFDESLLIEKLSQGLRLLRVSIADEERFINELKDHLSAKLEPLLSSNADRGAESGARIESEATVSPSGESILNADDLNEIAQLINGEPVNDDYAASEENAQLLDCLSSVDGMSACSSVQMLIKGKLHDCVVTKSGARDDVFVITSSHSNTSTRKIAITRSRLGLAISLRRGEILLSEEVITPVACNITVFERKS